MYIIIVLLPFLGFLYAGTFGSFFGRGASSVLSTLFIFLSFFCSVFIFYEVGLSGAEVIVPLFVWVSMDIFVVDLAFLFDGLTASMLLIVTSVSSLVHLYSMGYMSHDPHLTRFISYLSLFTFFMLLLVTANNYIQLFIGWEGVGLCSFLLINFWYTRILATKAALKAMIMNRIADVFFIIGIIFIFINFKTTDYLVVFNLLEFMKNDTIVFFNFYLNKLDLICFFLFVGAVGKSAQLGLHTWLPDAMEGPTPVSSLLHAATMVTAGVFLLLRSSPVFEYSDAVLLLIALIGSATAIFSAIIGLFQYDVKKIIAYSTCSQLGYMFFSCGLSNYTVAIFHLVNHAFFKALLFLSAGSIIHALYDEQDMRKMGNLVNFLPFTYYTFLLGSLAIMGFPFLTGFYSKDLLLELVYSRYILDSTFVHFLGIFSAFFTAAYSVRLLIFVFFHKFNGFRTSFLSVAEASIHMSVSMLVLAFASIFFGFIFSDLYIGWGSFFWGESLFTKYNHFDSLESEFLSPFIKNAPFLLSISGVFTAYVLIYLFDLFSTKSYFSFMPVNYIYFIWNRLSSFFYNAGFFNSLYNRIFLDLLALSYYSTNKYIDKGILEFFGPFGFYLLSNKLSKYVKGATPTVIFFVLGWMFFFVVFFIMYMVLYTYVINFFGLNVEIISLSLLFCLSVWESE